MRPLRFWQKTYLFTLILFLVGLNAGIFHLSYTSYQRSVKAEEEACESQAFYILRIFENDYETTVAGNSSAIPLLLMQNYGSYYQNEGLSLVFRSPDGAVLYSSFDKALTHPDQNIIRHQTLDGRRYLVLSSDLCDGQFLFTYIKDVSELDAEFRETLLTFTLVSVVLSAALAVGLFLILRGLSLPLDRLRLLTEQIAKGNYSDRAEERGGDEFAELGRSFNTMLDRINDQMDDLARSAEQKQQLVDNLAHELRTPLTSIHGYAEYIQKAPMTEEELYEATDYILNDAKRLQSVSNKLLDSAFIRNNEIERETVDLTALLENTVLRLSAKAESRRIALTAEPQPLTVLGDGILLDVLLSNLTDNALKACSAGGHVCLSCRSTEEGTEMTVTDDGRGMTAEQLLHVTEPFYRTDKARSRADGGSGLGLALCQHICDAHGASLLFRSVPDEGTTVTVRFPNV